MTTSIPPGLAALAVVVGTLLGPGCPRTEVPRGIRFVAAAAGGDLSAGIHAADVEAAREQRRLLVYVGAAWCEPCRAFHEAAESGALNATFPDLTLLELDADRDGARLTAAGYDVRMIPLFALPGSDGRATGRAIAGARRGDWVGDITPRLRELLAGARAAPDPL